MSTLEQDINSCIAFREQLIQRARKLVDVSLHLNPKMVGITARELVNLSNDLRDHGIRCVQKIAVWTLESSSDREPKRFLHNGEEYLLKMLHDLDFIALELHQSLRHHGDFVVMDPFFINRSSIDAASHRAALGAMFIVLDACARHQKAAPPPVIAPRTTASVLQRSTSGEMNSPLQPRRKAITNIYSPNTVDEDKSVMDAMLARSSSKVTKEPSVKFKGKLLYRRGKPLGEGAFAEVFECERQDGQRFAVKIFLPPTEEDDEETIEYMRKCTTREITFLRMMSHPHIVTFEETMVYNGQTHIVMEKMSCSLLQYQVDRSTRASIGAVAPVEKAALSVLEQISDALAYMHSKRVLHRDIKPENILVIASAVEVLAKLGDLGSATRLPIGHSAFSSVVSTHGDLTHYVGSRWYRAPEVLGNGMYYSYPSDIWSLGSTIAEFIIGDPIFEGDSEQEVCNSILNYYHNDMISPDFEKGLKQRNLFIDADRSIRSYHVTLNMISSPFRKIIESMLILNPIERYAADYINKDLRELMQQEEISTY